MTSSIIFEPVLFMCMITIKTHKFNYAAQQGWGITYTQEINVMKIFIAALLLCVCVHVLALSTKVSLLLAKRGHFGWSSQL